MSCTQTLSAISRDCSPNMGGIKRVLLANRADVSTITITTNEVSAIVMVSSKKFLPFDFKAGTSSMSSNYQVNAENGVAYVQTDLVMVFNRMETAKRTAIAALAQADLYAIVEDMNGKYWLLGYDEEVVFTAGDGLSGTARTDRNGYSVTLTDNSKELPMEVASSVIEDII